MTRLRIISIADGNVTLPSSLPDGLRQVAQDAYNGVRGSPRRSPSQEDVEELIAACIALLDDANGESPSFDVYCSEDDPEAEQVTDVVCMCPGGRYHWHDLVREPETLSPFQLIAAYAVYKTDEAAACWLRDDTPAAFEALLTTCQLAADYGFHYGHDDRESVITAEGKFHALTSTRIKAQRSVRDHILERWAAGPSGTGDAWKSKAAFAREVAPDAMRLAKERGTVLVQNNVERTVCEWVTKAQKRAGRTSKNTT